MIASFRHNFVFVRTRKTASTSCEIVLGSWCGPEDIVTTIRVEDELTRFALGGAPQNYSDHPEREERYRQSLRSGDRTAMEVLWREVQDKPRFHAHQTAHVLSGLLPADFWKGAFKFAVERHPYEKAVSLAYWRARDRGLGEKDHAAFLNQMIEKGTYRNFDIYAHDGRLLVDQVIPYESLWATMAELAKRWNVSIPEAVPLAKASYRQDRRSAREILSEEQRRKVYETCREEFELMGYEA